jgi:hypothetical protein
LNETLVATCQMFLVPATILFAAVGVANTRFVKLLVCLLGWPLPRYGSIASGYGPDSRWLTAGPGLASPGRKQYRYHARFREVRESTKYEHVVAFADALPAIREKSTSIWASADCRVKRCWRPSYKFRRPH